MRADDYGSGKQNGKVEMEKPTIRSSKPDVMGRTTRMDDSLTRRSTFGSIQPMNDQRPRNRWSLSRLVSLF